MSVKSLQQNIPSGWKQATLATVSDIVMGQSPDSSSYNKAGDGLPFFQGKADFTDTYKTIIRQWTTEPTKIAEPADTLISVRAPVGDVAVNNVRACIGRGLAAVRAKQRITDQVYLFYVLQSLKTFFNTKAQGSTFTAINGPELKKISTLLPPIKEQQKIAEILGTVDEDIAKTQEVIDATEKLKRGLMQQLFTCGIGHTKFKETKIGQIPEEWEVKKIGDLGSVITGNTPKTSDRGNYGEEYLFVSPKDIGSTKYINDSESKLSRKGFDTTRKIPSGSVLVVCIGSTIGKIAVAGIELSTNQQINSVVVNENYSNEFVYYQLLHRKNEIIGKRSTQAVPIINKTDFSEIPIALPKKKEEQQEIAEILSAVDEKILVNKKLKEKLTLLKKGLMQDLLSGKVRTITN